MSAMGCGSSCMREISVSCEGVALRDRESMLVVVVTLLLCHQPGHRSLSRSFKIA